MLLTSIKEAQKLANARVQPNLCFVPFSITDTLAEIKAALFSDVSHQVSIQFVSLGSLACVYRHGDQARIYIHQLLNHHETPFEVISLICKHELLHLRIPSVEKEGKWLHHPPEFWKAEKAICPERNKAWAWIWINLVACLKTRPRLERIDVLPVWKEVWSEPKKDAETCQKLWIRGEFSGPDEEGGW